MRIFSVMACLLLLVAVPFGPQTGVQGNKRTAESAKDFVQGFYSWYVPEALKTGWGVALKYKGSAFSPALFRALKEDSDAQEKANGELVGLDFDPFLNAQDPCDRYEVGTATAQSARYRVDVYGVCSGKRHKKPDVVAEVAHRDGSWVFINFVYPAIHSDLLSTLRILRDERRKSSR